MTTSELEQLVRETLEEQAGVGMHDADTAAALERFREAASRRRGGQNRLVLIAACAVVVLAAGVLTALVVRSVDSSPSPPAHRSRAVLSAGRIAIHTSGNPNIGTFTLSGPGGASDHGTYSVTEVNPSAAPSRSVVFMDLTGGLGQLTISWIADQNLIPAAEPIEYGWDITSGTGVYAGVAGGGLAVTPSSPSAATAVWSLTGAVRRTTGDPSSAAWPAVGPVDMAGGIYDLPTDSATFSLASASGVIDVLAGKPTGSKVLPGGRLQVEREFSSTLGTFAMTSTFGPAAADQVRQESWRIVGGTGVYANLSGSGTGSFVPSLSPVFIHFSEELRGDLTS
jgi:hypothetical protein